MCVWVSVFAGNGGARSLFTYSFFLPFSVLTTAARVRVITRWYAYSAHGRGGIYIIISFLRASIRAPAGGTVHRDLARCFSSSVYFLCISFVTHLERIKSSCKIGWGGTFCIFLVRVFTTVSRRFARYKPPLSPLPQSFAARPIFFDHTVVTIHCQRSFYIETFVH